MNAEQLASRLEGVRRTGKGFAGRCPLCRYPSACRIEDGRMAALVFCHCCRAPGADLLEAIRSDASSKQACATHVRSPEPENTDSAARIVDWWRRTLPAAGTVVEDYLRHRGITLPIPSVLRLMPRAWHGESESRGPAMVACVARWPGDEVCALHRTWVRADGRGKADLDPPRKTWGQVRGGALRLAEAGTTLVVGEGIESTLSAMQIFEQPGWAALSAGNLEYVMLPEQVRSIVIVADRDQPGLAAAHRAKNRWRAEGRAVQILAPREQGHDANDVLQER